METENREYSTSVARIRRYSPCQTISVHKKKSLQKTFNTYVYQTIQISLHNSTSLVNNHHKKPAQKIWMIYFDETKKIFFSN